MNRLFLGVLAAGVVLTGCERFAARSDIAAEAGPMTLTAERVGGIVGKIGQGPTIQAAEFVSNLWLDYALFARAVADNAIKTDSATIAAIRWPTIANARVKVWHDTVVARRGPPSAGAIDSAYQSTGARLLQHLIVIPKGEKKAADSAVARRAVENALARIKAGTPFGTVAAEIGEDGSKNDQGYLGYLPKGQLVKEFEDVGYALAPGEMSGVVLTQFGYHLIRRPTLDESRGRLTQALSAQSGAADTAYVKAVTEKEGLKVASGAAAAIKAALVDPASARSSKRTLVSLKSGDVTVGDFVKWTTLIPYNNRLQFRQADDSLVTGYAKGFAEQVLMHRQADSAKIQLPAPMWQFITVQYTQTIEQLRNNLGLNVAELSETSTLTPEQKHKLAGEKVEDYFKRLVEGQAQMSVVLPELADHLRGQGLGKVNQAGLARSVELAMAQYRRDSAAAAARPPESVIRPAPGGPPVAGGDTAGGKQ